MIELPQIITRQLDCAGVPSNVLIYFSDIVTAYDVNKRLVRQGFFTELHFFDQNFLSFVTQKKLFKLPPNPGPLDAFRLMVHYKGITLQQVLLPTKTINGFNTFLFCMVPYQLIKFKHVFNRSLDQYVRQLRSSTRLIMPIWI